MLRGFSAEIRRLFFFLVITIILGLAVGYLSWTLVAGAILYICWMLVQIHKLDTWLLSRRRQPPPDASGIWGDIFDNIHRLQKQQRNEQRRLKSVINRVQETTAALRDGVILLDGKSNIDWFNKAAQRLIGLQNSDQSHSVLNYLRHPKFVEYFEAGDYSDPLELPSPRFVGKYLQYQITKFGQGERLLVVRDITQLHHLEQMRQDFIGNVSHELRTPLTVIRGYLETLMDSGTMPGKWGKPMNQMHQQAERMNLLVSDLITLSKLETEDYQGKQKAVALVPLVDMIVDEARALSGDRNHCIRFRHFGPVEINGCEKELHSALSNLVFNAVKYTPEHCEIDIKLWCDTQGVHIQVKDSGPGFDAKHIPRLTERFYRVDSSRNSATGGTGLGLAIVKHVLMRHDAELTIDAEINKGACFGCHFSMNRLQSHSPEKAS